MTAIRAAPSPADREVEQVSQFLLMQPFRRWLKGIYPVGALVGGAAHHGGLVRRQQGGVFARDYTSGW